MPHYDFEDDDGEVVELWLTMSAAPRIGETMEHEGRRLTRILSLALPEGTVQREIDCVVVQQAAPWAPGANHYVMDPKSTDYGQPVLTSRRDVKQFLRSNPGATYGEGTSRIE